MPYNQNIFQVSWKRFVRMFTPVDLRKNKTLALLYAIINTVGELHSRFLAFRTNVQYRLGINYQVCNLERLLNDTYDVDARRIYINNQPTKFLPVILFTKAEGRPVKFFTKAEGNPVIFYVLDETPAGYLSFIIFVHQDIVFNLDELAGLVRQYCLTTKSFKVQLYA